MSVASFLSQSIQGYNVTDLAKWVSYQTIMSSNYGELTPAFILMHWGFESGWGGADISQYFNPANQGSGCGVGATCGTEPNGLPAFCSIVDGVKAYSALLIDGYPHVMFAFSDAGYGSAGINAAGVALGSGYYANYTGGSDSYCSNGKSYTLTSASGARIWAQNPYGNPPGSDFLATFNANTDLQNLNTTPNTNPLPNF